MGYCLRSRSVLPDTRAPDAVLCQLLATRSLKGQWMSRCQKANILCRLDDPEQPKKDIRLVSAEMGLP